MLLVTDPHLDRYGAKEARPVQNSTKGTSILRPCDAINAVEKFLFISCQSKKGAVTLENSFINCEQLALAFIESPSIQLNSIHSLFNGTPQAQQQKFVSDCGRR